MKFLERIGDAIDTAAVRIANVGVGTHLEEVVEDHLPPGYAGDLGVDVAGGPGCYITNVIKLRRLDNGQERLASNHGMNAHRGEVLEIGNRALARTVTRPH